MTSFHRKLLFIQLPVTVLGLFVISAGTAYANDIANPVSRTELAIVNGGVASTPTCSIGTVYRYASRIDRSGNPHAEYVCLPQFAPIAPTSLVTGTPSSISAADTSADIGGSFANFTALLATFPSYIDPCGNDKNGGWHLATIGETLAIATGAISIFSDVRGRTGSGIKNASSAANTYSEKFNDAYAITSTTYGAFSSGTVASSFEIYNPYVGYGYAQEDIDNAYKTRITSTHDNDGSTLSFYFCTMEV